LVKRNPGKKYHNSIPFVRKGCGSNGYESIDVVQLSSIASAKDGQTHTLQADLYANGSQGTDLVVFIDGQEVWRGAIHDDLLRDIDGPAGLRTDNGSFIFKLLTGRKWIRDHR
jgi:hypothetical protein